MILSKPTRWNLPKASSAALAMSSSLQEMFATLHADIAILHLTCFLIISSECM